MFNLILFAFVAYGITLIVVQSKIMKPFREFFKKRIKWIYTLLTCMMCAGSWVSLGLAFLLPLSNQFYLDTAFGIGAIWLIHTIQIYFESNSKIDL